MICTCKFKPAKKSAPYPARLFLSKQFVAPKAPQPRLKVVRVPALGMWTHLSSFQVPQHAVITAWGRSCPPPKAVFSHMFNLVVGYSLTGNEKNLPELGMMFIIHDNIADGLWHWLHRESEAWDFHMPASEKPEVCEL